MKGPDQLKWPSPPLALIVMQVRIKYLFFYTWQPPCMTSPEPKGMHQGDWEAFTVTLSQDRQRIAAVSYHQHGGWYTRVAGRSGFEVGGE